MKIKSLLIILSVLVSHLCDAQLFNRRVLNNNYGWSAMSYSFVTTKTVAKDNSGNIFLLSTNILNGYPQIVKLSPAGAFLQVIELDPASLGIQFNLMIRSIIHTYDDNLLVIGNYFEGAFPPGYPLPMNGATPLSAIFYAKFDNNLNLLSFKVHCGYPHVSMQPIDNGEAQFVKDIAVVPDSNGYDNYYILSMNEGSIYTTPALIVSVLNHNLVPIAERVLPNDSLYFDGWHIDYLGNHGVLAINGFYFADSTVYPAIVTLNKGLNLLTPLTAIANPALMESYRLTNTIEEPSSNNLIWGFNVAPSYTSCLESTITHCYLIKQDISTLNYTLDREYDFCVNTYSSPVELYHNSSNPQGGFVMGLSSYYQDSDYEPALLNLGYNLIPTDYHKYASVDNIDGQLLSFIPYNNFFVLHSLNADTIGHSRIIRTDNVGRSYCSARYPAISKKIVPELFHVEIEWTSSPAEAYDTIPVISNEAYSMDSCSTMGNKQPTTGIAGASLSNMKIYPNPVNGNYLFIEGDMQDGTGFILENLFGSTVYKGETDSNKNRMRLDLSNISPGMYVLKILSGGKLQRVEKIVIQ